MIDLRRRRKGGAPGVIVARMSVLAAAAVLATGASAQLTDIGGEVTESGRTYFFRGDLTITETLTDNVRQESTNPQWDLITEIRPSFTLGVRNRWARASIRYSIYGLIYARDSSLNDIGQTLSIGAGAGDAASFELIENRLFFDVGADVSQRVSDPFGQRPPSGNRTNENLETVASYYLSPYLVGNLGGAARYRLGVSHAGRTEGNSTNIDAWTTSASASIFSGRDFGRLGWAIDASRSIDDFDSGRRTDRASLVGTLSYTVDPTLILNASAGSEWNNLQSVNEQRYDRYGGGFQWLPSPRTSLSAFFEERFFGTGYNVQFRHRAPRSVWTYSAVRDISELQGSYLGVTGTAFDLFYEQFATIEPDPLLREQLVADYLQRNNIPSNALVVSEFVYDSATLADTHRLSFAWLWPRTTWTASAYYRNSSRVDDVSNADDIFAESDFVRERGVIFRVSHRLTPLSSLGARLSEDRSDGELDTQSTRTREASVTWSTRLNPRMTFAVTGRHTNFSSQTNPYRENELEAVLNVQLF